MRYNRLGSTGLVVSELCLGTMTFGTAPGMFEAIAGLDQDAATAMVRQAIDAGVNFIDTANMYSAGESERLTGAALKTLGIARDDVIVATKALGPMGEGPNDAGFSRAHLLAQIDGSLGRLGLDHIDLYQIHGWDPQTPMEEALRAMEDIVRSGRASYIGVSNWAAWQIAKGLGIAQRRGWDKIASLQAYYSLVGRDLERELVPMLSSEGVGLMVWSPLAGGFLSGKYTREGSDQGRRANFDFPPVEQNRGFAVVNVLRDVAAAQDATVAQVALAWLLHQPAVSTVIMGAKRADQLADNLGATELELTSEQLQSIDEASRLTPEYPGWMVARQGSYRDQAVSPRRRAS